MRREFQKSVSQGVCTRGCLCCALMGDARGPTRGVIECSTVRTMAKVTAVFLSLASGVSSVDLRSVVQNHLTKETPTAGAQCWWLNGADPPAPCWTPSCKAPGGDLCDTAISACPNGVWVKAQTGPNGMGDCNAYNNGPNKCTALQSDPADNCNEGSSFREFPEG